MSTTTDRVGGISTSVAVKAPCRVATTANITLSGLQTIDGVSVVADDRVLVKDQSNTAENGIYYANSSTWSRTEDFDGTRDAVNGTSVLIFTGTLGAGYWYQVTFASVPPTIGTTTMTWAKTFIAASATQATETAAGVAELATQAETDTGTDDLRMVTPLKLKTELQAGAYDRAIVSTDAGATEAPTDDLYRNSASPFAADLLGARTWSAKSSTGVKRVVAKIRALYDTVTNAAESASLIFQTIISGTLATRMTLSNGLWMVGATGGDKGAGTVNATAFYQNGTALATVAKVISIVQATPYTANTDLATTIPLDDTIPTLTEGTQILTLSATTTTTTQKILVEFNGYGETGNQALITALNDGSSTIKTALMKGDGGTYIPIVLKHVYSPAATGTFTFNIRVGGSSGTVRMNGSLSARYFGGTEACDLVATVYEP